MSDMDDSGSEPTQAEKWLAEIERRSPAIEAWEKRAKGIVKRYRDEKDAETVRSEKAKKLNILWSNVQTILPAMYARTPRAQVERTHKDQNPVARTSAMILERALQYELDKRQDFDETMRMCVLDRLLGGRATAWVLFETHTRKTVMGDQEYKCTPVQYVDWRDFKHSDARCWQEVTWVAKRSYMSRGEGLKRFGKVFKQVELSDKPMGVDDETKANKSKGKKAKVWEIWDKTSKKVIFVAEGCRELLEERDDPLGLEDFWPMPKPLYASLTNDSLIPLPDYAQYQYQATTLDELETRIDLLVKALRVVGVYDASQRALASMLEGSENTMVPVDQWAAFAERGGVKGTVDFLPIEMIAAVLSGLYQASDLTKQKIYEITGISDIVRGASIASETATAQQIKSQFASLRIKYSQRDIAIFASEIIKIKAQIMCDFYDEAQLAEMSGIMQTGDAQHVPQAMQMLKAEQARAYNVTIDADTMVEIDEASQKAERVEFLGAIGGFIQQALPVAQATPDMVPLINEMMLFAVRAYKGGRTLEAAFEAFVEKTNTAMQQAEQAKQMQAQQPPKPTPEEVAMQQEQVKMQAELQLEQQKMQMQAQIEAAKTEQAQQLAMIKAQADIERAKIIAEIEAKTKIVIAQITAGQKTEQAVIESATETEAIAQAKIAEYNDEMSEESNEMPENGENEEG